MGESDPKNDPTTRRIDMELDQQVERKEMPDSTERKTEPRKSQRKEK
jgi:hypothetical protein